MWLGSTTLDWLLKNLNKIILCATWIDKFPVCVKKIGQNNSMCDLDRQILTLCDNYEKNISISELNWQSTTISKIIPIFYVGNWHNVVL